MRLGRISRARQSGFTIAEVAMGMVAMVLIATACLSTMVFSRVASTKTREEGVALDFLMHYMENFRGLDFDAIQGGVPINSLMDGTDGAPNIRIPTNAGFFSIDNDNYRTFHPELVWFTGRNPELNAALIVHMVAGKPHLKHLSLTLRWDPPLGRGPTLTAHLDMVRVRDL